MEAAIIKAISDAGLGLGSLLIMAMLFVYQLKTNQRIMEKFSDKMDKNTEAQQEMIEMIKGFRETDRDVIKAIEWCKQTHKV